MLANANQTVYQKAHVSNRKTKKKKKISRQSQGLTHNGPLLQDTHAHAHAPEKAAKSSIVSGTAGRKKK